MFTPPSGANHFSTCGTGKKITQRVLGRRAKPTKTSTASGRIEKVLSYDSVQRKLQEARARYRGIKVQGPVTQQGVGPVQHAPEIGKKRRYRSGSTSYSYGIDGSESVERNQVLSEELYWACFRTKRICSSISRDFAGDYHLFQAIYAFGTIHKST